MPYADKEKKYELTRNWMKRNYKYKWREYEATRDPLKVRARQEMHLAVRRGELKRQTVCECGSDYRVQAHHEDYTKPLDVEWLCEPCHKKR